MAFKLVRPKKSYDEVVCKLQRDAFMTKKWCLYAQYNELCHGCPENQGWVKSRYQTEKESKKL